MQEKLNTIQSNIENLTSLWKTAAIPFDGYFNHRSYSYVEVNNSDWPNRIWFNNNVTTDDLEMALKNIKPGNTKFHLPLWHIYNNTAYEMIEAKGFPKTSEQAGMSLPLQEPFELKNMLEYKVVSTEAEATLWTNLFPQAFGYRIHPAILMKTMGRIQYYIAYYQNQPIGTAILYITGNIAGIHAVGVIPDMRRKGFAEEIMKFIINKSIELNAVYATLQASKMGKDLYLKMGFADEFVINNYRLRG
jgi:GNAT superfamily N-acetyltransferase